MREEKVLRGNKFFVWLIYAILLFGVERRLMETLVSQKTPPEKAFNRLSVFHWLVLILSLISVVAGIQLLRG